MYTPLKDIREAEVWAGQTLVSVREPVAPHAFIASNIGKNVSYTLLDGTLQPIRVYLIRPDITHNSYGIFFHGVHAILDAKGSLNAISLLLEWMSTPTLGDVADLPWGKEYENLPPGPINATGGPREDWGTNGTALLMKLGAHYANETVSSSIVLLCRTRRCS